MWCAVPPLHGHNHRSSFHGIVWSGGSTSESHHASLLIRDEILLACSEPSQVINKIWHIFRMPTLAGPSQQGAQILNHFNDNRASILPLTGLTGTYLGLLSDICDSAHRPKLLMNFSGATEKLCYRQKHNSSCHPPPPHLNSRKILSRWYQP